MIMRRLGLLRALSLPVFTAALAAPALAEDRALVIGINKYGNPDISTLKGAVNDAKRMASLAETLWNFRPQQIKMLLDEQATAAAMKRALQEWLVDGTKPGDRVFFYYSGHGSQVKDLDGDEKIDHKDEIITSTDTGVRSNTNYVSDDFIGVIIKKLEGREVIMMFDSCHSGTMTRALNLDALDSATQVVKSMDASKAPRDVSDAEFESIRRDNILDSIYPNAMSWFAVSPSQYSLDVTVGTTSGGLFTDVFTGGLLTKSADVDKDGRVSAAELLAHIDREQEEFCKRSECASKSLTSLLEAPSGMLARDMLAWRSAADAPVVAANEPVADAAEEPAVTAEQPQAQNQPEQQAEPQPQNEPAPAPVTAYIPAVNPSAVVAEIIGGSTIRLGDEISIRVASPVAGYLIVLDAKDDGRIEQLYPSANCQNAGWKISANAPVWLPDKALGCAFAANEAGAGEIIAIVSQDPLRLEDLLQKNGGAELKPGAKRDLYLEEISSQLSQVWTGDDNNRAVRWSMGRFAYTVAAK